MLGPCVSEASQEIVLARSHFRQEPIHHMVLLGFPAVFTLWSYITGYMNNGSWNYLIFQKIPLVLLPVFVALAMVLLLNTYEGVCIAHVFYFLKKHL